MEKYNEEEFFNASLIKKFQMDPEKAEFLVDDEARELRKQLNVFLLALHLVQVKDAKLYESAMEFAEKESADMQSEIDEIKNAKN